MTSSKDQANDKRIKADYLAKEPDPTKARPGSSAKIEAMRKRFENGESFFHDDDSTNEGEIGGVLNLARTRTNAREVQN